MENRKYVKFLIPICLVLGFFIVTARDAFAYETNTHAFLTKDAIQFYSEKAATSTMTDFESYLIDGSRREDDIPRWMNHFYDPVNSKGLTDSVLGSWSASKDWAVNADTQNQLKYKVPATIASILTAIQQGKISDLSAETNFTWNEALYYWMNGEKEKAAFALGHVLHLIQDASVPDHTRNDPHPDGSIFESWAGKYSLDNPDNDLLVRLKDKDLVGLNSLDLYFTGMAKYSNNNFYSADTILKNYQLPEINDFELIDNHYYYTGYLDGQKYYLLSKKSNFGSVIFASEGTITINNEIINKNYWSLLSTKSVQYSASAIKFFLSEADRLKNDSSFAKKNSFFAQVVDLTKQVISNIFGGNNSQDSNVVAEINLGDSQTNNLVSVASKDTTKDPVVENSPIDLLDTPDINDSVIESPEQVINEEEIVKESDIIPETENKEVVVKIAATTTPIIQNSPVISCGFETNKALTRKNVLINEVAWMGSIKSSSDEWIELKNTSNLEIDISNWQLLDKEEQVKVIFPDKSKIAPNSFLLLERTDDNTVPNIKADYIYTGSLSNSDEGLRLFDNGCNLVDEVLAGTTWPAGDSSNKRTMEKQADLTWSTYNGSGEGVGEALILGTPKKENSVKVVYSGGGSVSTAPVQNNSTPESKNTVTQPEKILITEIQITGGTGKTNNDFIELYNPGDIRINLNGYRLVKRTKSGTADTGIKSWTSDTFIEPKSFYLWANSDYSEIVAIPDVTTSGTLSNDNGIALRFGAEDTGVIIDSVAWGEAENIFKERLNFSENPAANNSIQRKVENGIFVDTNNNSADFEIKTCPSPKAQSNSCVVSENSNQAPSAFFDFSTTTPKINEEINFNAASSTDPDGAIVLYEWNFGDGAVASSTIATSTHSYVSTGTYSVNLMVYDDKNATSTISKNINIETELLNKPKKVSNFLAQYNKINKEVEFNWEESEDYLGATSTLVYRIKDLSVEPLLSDIVVTASTTATSTIDVFDREYVFGIEAIDEFGIISDISTATIFIAGNSIEDVDYFIFNQDKILSVDQGSFGRLFKPQALGIVKSVTLNLFNAINYGDLQGISDVTVELYDWVGDSTTTNPIIGRGQKLAVSSSKQFYANNSGDYVWTFDNNNQIALDPNRYYYLQINSVSVRGNLVLFWSLSTPPNSSDKYLYVIIKAAEDGEVVINNPIGNNVYYDTNINFAVKYIEPLKNKYNSLFIELRDFYTEELVSDQIIDLSDDDKEIGWHEKIGGLNLNRLGYFKLKIYLSDSEKTEINFSVFGATPKEGTLLNQNKVDNSGIWSDSFSGQIFRPLVSGNIDSLTMSIISGDPNEVQADSYWSIYEWNGNGNDLSGSIGALLATTTSKFLIPTTYYPGPVVETWELSGVNEINLDFEKYYLLSLNIVPRVNTGRAARLYMQGSTNGSLIDGRLIGSGINQGDLYLIINKKVETEPIPAPEPVSDGFDLASTTQEAI